MHILLNSGAEKLSTSAFASFIQPAANAFKFAMSICDMIVFFMYIKGEDLRALELLSYLAYEHRSQFPFRFQTYIFLALWALWPLSKYLHVELVCLMAGSILTTSTIAAGGMSTSTIT